MQLLRRHVIYVQVHRDHLAARLVGEGKAVKRSCHALDNRRHELQDFSPIRATMRRMFKELNPGFTLRKPYVLVHFMPAHYTPTQKEGAGFLLAAKQAGASFTFASNGDSPHTDAELNEVFSAI